METTKERAGDQSFLRFFWYPPWELTYPLRAGTFEDDVPFPNVGYVIVLPGGYFVCHAALR